MFFAIFLATVSKSCKFCIIHFKLIIIDNESHFISNKTEIGNCLAY